MDPDIPLDRISILLSIICLTACTSMVLTAIACFAIAASFLK